MRRGGKLPGSLGLSSQGQCGEERGLGQGKVLSWHWLEVASVRSEIALNLHVSAISCAVLF